MVAALQHIYLPFFCMCLKMLGKGGQFILSYYSYPNVIEILPGEKIHGQISNFLQHY